MCTKLTVINRPLIKSVLKSRKQTDIKLKITRNDIVIKGRFFPSLTIMITYLLISKSKI